MRRVLIWSAALTWLVIGATARDASGQAAAVPLSLGVTASPTEVAVGDAVSVVVVLKNFKGDTLPASEPVTVTLHSELSGDATITLEKGQSSASQTIRFQRVGVATLAATAPNMTSGSAAIVVKAAAGAAAASSAGRGPAGVQPAPQAPVNPPQGAKISLAVDILPQHVHPANAAWKALVLVTAINDTRQPVAVPVDTDVYLATDVGVVMPATTVIAAGKTRTTETIQLLSNHPGAGTLWVWTDSGVLTAAAVEYHDAVPTQLLVRGLPSRAVNDGRTVVNVTVFLQDDSGATASAVDDVVVKLTSSVGTANPSDLTIAKGKFYAEAVLTSATSGIADITATAARLIPGKTQVEFVFPLLLVFLAAIGGTVGSIVRSGRQLLSGAWWWHVLGSVGMGIVLGLLFYALAQFGIIASIPKLAIPLEKLPTTNDLGALVLGFVGGYYGRSWLPDPEGT